MQRGKKDEFGVTIVPPLPPGHYFLSFCEEFWNVKDPFFRTGRIEIYRPGEMYAETELRWYFPDTAGMTASFDLFRDYWDFINVTERELERMKKQLKFFQKEEQ